MKFLYNQLGDWYLAMAAYDWGAGSIQRAVQKTGYADFWELYKRNNLPGETKNYVPEILAAIIIARNPHQYGFDDVQLDAPITTDTVPIDYPLDLRLVADLVDAEPQELIALNPGLLRMTTPPPGILTTPFELHLPAGEATVFKQRISEIPEARRTQWRYHRVTPEDSLASVARSYHVSVEQLATVNQLQSGDTLDSVEALVVPVAPPAATVVRAESYRARKGDTLVKIADRFGVSLDDLRRWNHVTGTSVAAGQRIRVTEPARIASRTNNPSHSSSQSAQSAPASVSSKSSGKHASQKKTTDKSTLNKKTGAASVKGKAAPAAHISSNSKKADANHKSTTKKKVKK